MAVKKPLCIYSGDIKELQAGDTTPSGATLTIAQIMARVMLRT